MPPRSKQSKQAEWVLCSSCCCNISKKDVIAHEKVCSAEKPVNFDTLVLASVQHGLFYKSGDVAFLVTQLQTPSSDITGMCEHVPVAAVKSFVVMNPVTMVLCGLGIGKPVIVNGTNLFTAWPNTTLSLTTVCVKLSTMAEMGWANNDFLILQKPSSALLPAKEIHLKPVQEFSYSRSDDFKSFTKRHLVGRNVTVSNMIDLNYYGQVNKLRVEKLVTADHSLESSEDSIDNLRTKMSELNVSTDGDKKGKASTYSCSNEYTEKIILEQARTFRMFSSVEFNTRVYINSNSKTNSGNDEKLTLNDIGGYQKQIKELKEMIELHLFKSDKMLAHGMSCPHGALLYGPSGSGKSHMIRALLSSLPVSQVHIVAPEVWSKYYGESEARLSSMFKEAKEKAPCVIFIDEIDALCPKRESSHNEVEKRVVASLVTLIDSVLGDRSGVFLLAATNKRDRIDSSLRRPGRLDREIEIGVPDVRDRTEILCKLLSKMKHVLSEDGIGSVAEQAHGFVAADLSALVKDAALRVLKKQQDAVTLSDLTSALQTVQPSAMREVAIEVPNVKWDDIGGQKELKHKLRQAIEWPLKHPEAFSRLGIRPPRGLLMYGPPGCSKTMIAKALARESGLNFIAIKGPELFSKWVGESERAIREVFRKARAAAPAIVFFDEIDAVAVERGSSGGGGNDVADRVLAQILTEIDGVDALKDVTVVAATNRPDRIDKALLRPGRLDRIVYVPLPDPDTRREIFSIHFRRMPVGEDVSLEHLVTSTEKYSGAEVSAVCHEAALAAMQEDVNIAEISRRHFDQALTQVKPRITSELIDFYTNYHQASGLHSV